MHIFFKGYFVQNHSRMATRQDVFGQLWKEYALSDSRYLSSDTTILVMEAVTVCVQGSLSYLMVALIIFSHPLRYLVQGLVSLGHIHFDIIYLATAWFDERHRGISYCRPEPYYFWFYYFGMNFTWIAVPARKSLSLADSRLSLIP